ncbi:hydroxymethylbilane synthase [Planctomicrobium piriforme]|uniref:Porphobilinogen deaminase n=1 Tax=Planctomicrobium piriforme TaxID=1576369 RepID=A0A1I3GUS3_9PLAN|nr:hydroxymethylbilane synthase [Planctomicrobium piriforme]SFI27111.1 hydroxymethylbilane synthase [Planctomicrobium piriforme]
MTESQPRRIRIATRESQLALWQANHVAEQIRRVDPECDVQLVPMTTAGDRDRQTSLPQMGGQGVFTKEVQRAVLDGVADIAVHSLKDLPTDETPGLALAGIPPRAPRFDALILKPDGPQTLDDLPPQARIGTSSPRRRSQLLRLRPDFQLLEIRGNVETRLKKVEQGEYDAIVLAEAGLRRLGLQDCITVILAPPIMYPAVGQAALGIECRDNDEYCRQILEGLTDAHTQAEVLAERACLAALRAGCHAPVGVRSTVHGETLTLEAVVLSQDGADFFQVQAVGSTANPRQVGIDAAQLLIQEGAGAVL